MCLAISEYSVGKQVPGANSLISTFIMCSPDSFQAHYQVSWYAKHKVTRKDFFIPSSVYGPLAFVVNRPLYG